MPSKIALLYIMPAPHAGMPLFTTWYALIPSIILCVPGGHKALCPPAMLSKVRLFSNQAVPNGVLEEGGEWLERLPEFKAWPTSLSAKA